MSVDILFAWQRLRRQIMSKNLIILITVIGLILIVYNLGRLFFT